LCYAVVMNTQSPENSTDDLDLIEHDTADSDESVMHGLASFTATDDDAGTRLDKFLAVQRSDLSRTRIKGLVLEGAVTVAGAVELDPNKKLQAGAIVGILIPEAVPAIPQAEEIPLTIVYEDDHLIVIDKPAGLVVHPAAGHVSGTLVNALISHCGDSLSGIGGVKRPGIVHRLDKDTTGLLVIAKNDRAHKKLADQFADHGRTGPLVRSYRAVVWGVPDRRSATIEAALDRSTKHRDRMAVVYGDRGRHAITHYEVLETFKGLDGTAVASLVACHLETGRTHQIRVHMTHIGHPLIGDPVYGTGFKTKTSLLADRTRETVKSFVRQALHAAELGFEHPKTGEEMHFESKDPADFANLLSKLRQ